eukprot:7710120-Pyramimonas_sp.AAC.1
MLRDKCVPMDQQQRVVIKVSDMNRKAIYELGSALEASSFHSNFHTTENMTYPDPKGNGKLFFFK